MVSEPGTADFPYPKQQVFAALIDAIPTVKGMAVHAADEQSGYILAKSGMSLMSWGESIPMTVTETGPGSTRVEITSKLKFGLVDWGKNRRNLEAILGATWQRLNPNHTEMPYAES